jgi:hypothetical protein
MASRILALGIETGMIPIEGVQGLDGGEPGGGQAGFDLAFELGAGLVGQEPFQEFLMGQIVFSSLRNDVGVGLRAGGEVQVAEHVREGLRGFLEQRRRRWIFHWS